MPQKLHPDDPRAHEAVIRRIKEMTREEWLAELRQWPDFDEAWVKPDPRKASGADGANASPRAWHE